LVAVISGVDLVRRAERRQRFGAGGGGIIGEKAHFPGFIGPSRAVNAVPASAGSAYDFLSRVYYNLAPSAYGFSKTSWD